MNPPHLLTLFFKAHVKGYVRRDGTVVRPHEDARQMVLFFHDTPVESPANYSNLSNNGPIENTRSVMDNYAITRSALGEKQAANLDNALAVLNASGPIIKARHTEMREDLSRLYSYAAKVEVSQPYLDIMNDLRPEWFSDVYYDCKSMASINKCKRACLAHPDSELGKRALAFFAEWEPVVEKMKARKADVTTAAAQREEKKVVELQAKESAPKTAMSKLVDEAINERKPGVAAKFKDYVTNRYSYMVKMLGPDLTGMYNKGNESFAMFYDRTLRSLVDTSGNLVPSLLDERAKQYADDVADAMRGKIMGKAGDLKDPEIKRMTGMNFVITGTMGGKKVHIEQNTIVNQSPLGNIFNQFPARIYVDGKFTPEARYKRNQMAS